MSKIYIDVDVALTELPVNEFPLTDNTDFLTWETAVAYNAAGMLLLWNFLTKAGVFTQTAVTPTTAGVYDWTHQGNAMYTIEVPASGGGSINNDTEGCGWFTGLATGIAPWKSPVYCFRPAALNNALVDGSDRLDVNAAEISDSAAAADKLEEGCEAIVSGTVGVGSTNTNVVSGLTTSVDQYNTKVITFKADTATVALRGLSSSITDTDASGNLTIVSIPTVPASGDTYVIT